MRRAAILQVAANDNGDVDEIHGEAGADLVSGAEALVGPYIGYFEPNNPEAVGVERSDYTRPFNPGNALA